MKACSLGSFMLSLLLSLCTFSLNAQAAAKDSLNLDDLIRISLEKNYNILIAKNQTEIAENNSRPGNAGLMPEIALDGGADYSVNNTNITFASPQQPEINATDAATTALNAGLSLSYTLYSGGRNRFVYRQLREGSYQQQQRSRADIESTILEVLQNYLSYLLQKEAFEIDQKAMEISLDRLERAENKFSFGAFTKLQLLNAEVDLRNDSTAFVQSKINHRKAYRQLLSSLSLSPDTNLTLSSNFELDRSLNYEELEDLAFQRNANYLLSESLVRTQELQLKIANSRWLPQIDLNAAYRYNYQNNEAGFIETQENYGFNGGVSIRYPLFQGGNRNRNRQNQEIALESENYRLEQAKIDLKINLKNAYEEYTSAIELMNLAERNIVAARQNFERSEIAFDNGQIDGLALREAQLNYLNSLYFHHSQRVQAKIAEASLLFISGSLVN